MAEKSIMWTTGSTGDGASSYTQAEVIRWLRQMMVGDNTEEGVHKNYSDELEVTDHGDGTVDVAAGAAIVYGFPYWNTATENVNIPTPAGATRIDRIVLRAGWAAQTVRITRVAGTEGTGLPPSLTQNDGVTWDIPLAQVAKTTGGVITITDEREFLHPNIMVGIDNIDDDSIDDTKAGNRVPQFYRRQGGSATSWDWAGPTNYTPTSVRMQAGRQSVGISNGNTEGTVVVTYPVAFSHEPLVFLSLAYTSRTSSFWVIGDTTASALTIYARRPATETSEGAILAVNWLAIGPE